MTLRTRKTAPFCPLHSRSHPARRQFNSIGAGLMFMLFPVLPNFAKDTEAPVTFTKDVAPIVFQNCVECHHPGGEAPFSLTTFKDANRRSRQIWEVVRDGLMPPWPPEHGYGEFAGERRLKPEEQDVLRRWVEAGSPQGEPGDLPSIPVFPSQWHLGSPDLVLTVGEGYTLPADGRDVYRNFSAAIPVTETRFVRAVEFQPENSLAVHHAFLKIDRSGRSRSLDAQSGLPGFSGMNVSAEMPPGNFLSWQPGSRPRPALGGLNWPLEPGTDLVVQMHLRPTGKPEPIKARVGFYFSDEPPSAIAERLTLASLSLDIAPGVTNHLVSQSFTLPVNAKVTSVLPHAHYLAREMKGYAELPAGRREWLLWIPSWDFNWQGHYQYEHPIELPKGTVLHMEFRYDNSTSNPQNPTVPPVRVHYGPNSTDEMAELWFQLVLETEADRNHLKKAYQQYKYDLFIRQAELKVARNPEDASAITELGVLLLGMMDTQDEGVGLLRKAIALDPKQADAYYYLGLWHRAASRTDEAQTKFEQAIQANPSHSRALSNMGVLMANRGRFEMSEDYFEKAIEANPQDELSKELLLEVRAFRRELKNSSN